MTEPGVTSSLPNAVEEQTVLDDEQRPPHVTNAEQPVAVQGQAQAAGEAQNAAPERQTAVAASRPRKAAALPHWAWLLVGGAAAGALLLLRHLRQRARARGRPQPVQVSPEELFSVVLNLASPLSGQPQPPPQPLTGRTLVVADRVDVEGVRTRFGSDDWCSSRQPSAASHAAVGALVGAGAQALAVVPVECLGLGPLLSSTSALPNPAAKGHTNGGGDFGAAVAVAAGHADLALAVDELGSARVPAACCGVYALRATAGAVALEGASTASHSLAAPALLARDPRVLLRAGEALRVLGGASRGDVAHYLVVEDFFAECDPGMQSMVPAVIAAVKRWAGPEQAQALSLCEWLRHRVRGLAAFTGQAEVPAPAPAGEAGQGSAGSNGGAQQGAPVRHTRSVLQALAAAAEVVRQWEFREKYGVWVDGAASSSSSSSGGGGLPQEVLRFQEQAQQVSEERYLAAQALMAELWEALRGALLGGYVFVLPTAPGEAPPSGDAQKCASFRQRCLEFSVLASLAGVPQVALPLPVPGRLPLSVSLLALHKKDLVLLQAAVRLGPLLAEEAAKLGRQQGQQQPAGAPAARQAGSGAADEPPAAGRASASGGPAAAGGGGGGGGGKGTAGARRGKKGGGATEQQAAQAEGCKEEGNAAFKAGKWDEAVRCYSRAVQLDPKQHVYYANRAMAYLKLGLYGQAEEDCNAALQLQLNVKALLRRGSARLAQGNADGAKADFQQALALEPQNRQAREELAAIQLMEAQLQLDAL